MDKLIKIEKLKPYYDIALETAKQSPCIRRRFGTVIVGESADFQMVTASNERYTSCCQGKICVRSRLWLSNGERVEVGAEVHAETAALIRWGLRDIHPAYLIMAGLNSKDEELLGTSVYSCHTCALNIKMSGFKWVYAKNEDGILSPLSVERMIERRQAEWQAEISSNY